MLAVIIPLGAFVTTSTLEAMAGIAFTCGSMYELSKQIFKPKNDKNTYM